METIFAQETALKEELKEEGRFFATVKKSQGKKAEQEREREREREKELSRALWRRNTLFLAFKTKIKYYMNATTLEISRPVSSGHLDIAGVVPSLESSGRLALQQKNMSRRP
ncbi:hypothetical protein RUM44_011480 [Polyplax serrata]|uniref:Uncharacterized protein n=1 Tax=Polyplax serrata TaxID=468196 RepID=A0ABR1AQ63_POLSC